MKDVGEDCGANNDPDVGPAVGTRVGVDPSGNDGTSVVVEGRVGSTIDTAVDTLLGTSVDTILGTSGRASVGISVGISLGTCVG